MTEENPGKADGSGSDSSSRGNTNEGNETSNQSGEESGAISDKNAATKIQSLFRDKKERNIIKGEKEKKNVGFQD